MPPQTPQIEITPYTSQVPMVQVPPQEFGGVQQASPEQGVYGGRNKSAGPLAIGDSIVKGLLKGHEYKEQKKAAQAQATIAAADAATDAAHQKYQAALSSSGGDVNSPDAKAAYDAYVQVFNKSKEAKAQFVIPQEQPKGSKTKGKDGKDPNKTGIFGNLKEWAAANPHVIPQLALLSMQPNPPGATPDTKKAIVESQREQQALAEGKIDLAESQRKQNAQAIYDRHSGLNPDELAALPAKDRQAFEAARAVLFPSKQTGQAKPYMTADGRKVWAYPGQEPEGAQAVFNETGGTTGGGKIGSEDDYARRYARENGNIPVNQLTTADLDYIRARRAYDMQHASSTSTTVTPGIDSTTSTSSRSVGAPPAPPRGRTWGDGGPAAAAAGSGGFTRPPAPRRAASGGGMTRPPAPGANAQPSAKRAQMTQVAETAKANAITNARKTLNATLEANAKNKNLSENPEALKQANDRANAAFQDELQVAYHAYDQKTIGMGGTPGGKKEAEKKKQSGPPPGASHEVLDGKTGAVIGYAVNGQFQPIGQ